MAKIYVKGDAVENATSYELFEVVDGSYISLATAEEINFEVSAMEFEAGDHVLVVRAHANGYTSSDYSDEVTYTISAGATLVTKTYETAGSYIAIADGSETESASWIHSDLLDITTLANNESGLCTSKLQGHAKVACIGFYSSNDLSSYISGSQLDTGAHKEYTVEEIQALAPEGAVYVNFSTHAAVKPLQITVME